jgi:hypothetical protein
MRYLIITMLAGTCAMLAACSSEKSGTVTTPDGETAEYTIDEASGETSMTIKTPQGDATMRSGEAVPVTLPDGFSLFPGSTVVTNTVVNQPDGAGTMVMFEAPATASAIIAHFKAAADKAGYAIEVEATMNETTMLAGKRKDSGASFMVSTGKMVDGKTSGQLVIGKDTGG